MNKELSSSGDKAKLEPPDTTLTEVLNAARSGDKLAANEALLHLHWLVSLENIHPLTGDLLPVPKVVREYLATALLRMANGQNANRAFNLTRSGEQHWTLEDRKLAAQLVAQFAAKPRIRNIEEAAAEAANAIPQMMRGLANPINSAWRSFIDRTPNEKTLKAWHAKFYGKKATSVESNEKSAIPVA